MKNKEKKMKKIKTTFLAMLAIATLTLSCTKKGEPSNQGEILTIEQIKALKNDQSMNGKLVTIEGYAGLCGLSSLVKLGKKNEMAIYSDGICEGVKLINANIEISRGGYQLAGPEPRNHADFPDENNIANESMTFMTDDYQEVKNEKLKFSGTVVYNGKYYSLDNVTIHK